MSIKWYKKSKNKKKGWHKKKKAYKKTKMTMFKVPKMKTIALKREQWLDVNFAAPGGSSWTIAGRTDPGVLENYPIMNFKFNTITTEGDPEQSRVTWQPIFTFEQLPDLSDVSGMFRMYKINKISITLFPMRRTNPILDTGAPTLPQTGVGAGQYLRGLIAPNLLITTLYAKTGLDNRIGYGTDSLAQIQNKSVKLYNLGIGDKKLGWYFKPYVQDITYKNPEAQITNLINGSLTGTPPAQIPRGQVDISECFTKTVRHPHYQDIERGKGTEHFGPLISFRTVDGSSLVEGSEAGNNMAFRVCVKYYFSLKGTH